MPQRYHLACYVRDDIFDQFKALAKSRHMTVTGLLRKLVTSELDGATLLPPAEAERNLLFIARALDGLLEAHSDKTLRNRIVRLGMMKYPGDFLMSYDPWNMSSRQGRFSKFLPEFLQKRTVQWAVWLLVAACINWQFSEHMNEQQYYFVSLYLRAHIAMFVGLDPVGNISVSSPEGSVDVTRLGITEHHYFTGSWSRFCDAILSGIGIAFFYTALAVTLSIANKYIEKSALKRQQALEEIERRAAIIKEQEARRWEKPNPASVVPGQAVEKETENNFESPQVELLTELIDEPGDEDSIPAPPPKEPSVTAPIRLPGRIYRSDD